MKRARNTRTTTSVVAKMRSAAKRKPEPVTLLETIKIEVCDSTDGDSELVMEEEAGN